MNLGHEVTVAFYRASELWRVGRRQVRRWPRFALYKMLVPRDPAHVTLIHDGRVFHCDAYRGCVVVSEDRFPLVPYLKTSVLVLKAPRYYPRHLGADYSAVQSIAHVLGFPVDHRGLVDCVRVTADLLGIDERLRRPSDLLRFLKGAGCNVRYL